MHMTDTHKRLLGLVGLVLLSLVLPAFVSMPLAILILGFAVVAYGVIFESKAHSDTDTN